MRGPRSGQAARACPLATRIRFAVRGYHRELPQRLDGDLLVEEVLAAGR